ncbi:hypothetical protein MMC26_000637 [Xylographa opegraphella]|nr:hypothetical protein [Xylographa opegraphella]
MPSALIVREEGPMLKRRKLSIAEKPVPCRPSRIFAPYRTLGLVSSTDVPFTSIPLGKTTFQITTSVGRCLHTYDLRKGLNLTFITRPQTPRDITATFAWKDRVFAAWGGSPAEGERGVWVFKRGKRIAELEGTAGMVEPVRQLLIFGSWIVGCCSTKLQVWKSATYEHYTTITSSHSRAGQVSQTLSGVLCSMPTMLNKVLVGKQDGSIEIWNLNTGKLIYTITPPKLHTGAVTALQPTPALNLLAIARADGSIIIHDIRVDKEIIVLNQSSSTSTVITSISFRTDDRGAGEDGRKPGVMATAGPEDGDVTLWDLNGGGRVMGILRNAHNPASTVRGDVSGGISRAEFLSGQPLLVTSGRDNALKSWIFDETPFSPVPRILHSRCGHAAPVTRLEFLPTDTDGSEAIGKWLLSAGRDQSLWGWSLRRDGQSTEISQGNIRKTAKKLGMLGKGLDLDSRASLEDLKAPEITCMACSLNRDGGMGASTGGGPVWANLATKKANAKTSDEPATGWESIVTGHKGDKFARTWFWGRKKAGRWAFETGDGTAVKSVAITPCGTFALVGSAGGSIDMFNLQSSIHRQKFPSPLTPAQARKQKIREANLTITDEMAIAAQRSFNPGEGKHTKDVTGIVVDSLNRTVISCSLDGKIKFWDFLTGVLRHEIDWHPMTAITAVQYHRPSDLIALACDDLSIRVVDIETRKLVRELWGCIGQISDFCFSPDGRWIVAASMDAVIRVWDLPTGHLINATRLDGTCTSLAFSPTGEFLATAHADSVGISIWTNRTLFTHVPSRHIGDSDVLLADLPTASGEGGEGLLAAAFDDDPSATDNDDNSDDTVPAQTEQLTAALTTLSLVPRSRWQTLLHLDTIATRNKPTAPPKAPEKAPFFLPSLEGPKPTTLPTIPTPTPPTPPSRILAHRPPAPSPTTTLLAAAARSADYTPLLTHLASLPPAAADVEIRSLDHRAQPSELRIFVQALTARLRQRRDYELVHAWMAVFLRVHGAAVGADEGLVEELRGWRDEAEGEGRRLGALGGYCAGVVGWVRSGR